MKLWPALAIELLAACAPRGASERDWALCMNDEGDANARIGACSAIAADAAQPRERRSDAYVQRGALYSASSQDARAVADFGRALRLNPHNARALHQRGILHQSRGADAVAEADFEAARRLGPGR